MKTVGILFFAIVAMSCTEHVNQVSPCNVSQDTIHYFTHIYPIINRTCSLPMCHVNESEHGNFKNVEEVMMAAHSGKLGFMIDTRQMPPAITRGKSLLTDCEITTIRAWINKGAPIN